jgi:3-oxoacyl-[acyl-carrier protein] reductase
VLDGKIALVTGASRGIGHAIAEALAKQGARVVGTATTEEGARKINGRVLNVRDAEKCDALIKELGDVAILVNNAGITRDNLALRMKDAEWDEVMETNLRAVFRLSRAVLRGMVKRRWGRIVGVGSVVGTIGNAGQANYAAAKAGLIGMSKSLAGEVATRNITVNVVSPGFIRTAMTDKLTDDQRAKILTRVPAERLGEPKDVAAGVVFLASEEAGYITGQTLHVNGGMAMI